MRRRLSSLVLFSALAALPLVHTGCGPTSVMPYTAEVDDPDYRRAKELLRMGREPEALAIFLRLIDQRGGAAPDSHLDAAILYQKHNDPIAAIYHFRRYRELRPNTEQARMALQSIEACIRDFAKTLPGQPLDNQVERTDLIDSVDRLQRENLQLKGQLAEARAAVLDASRTAGLANGGGGPDASVALPVEPSQGGFVTDAPGNTPPPRGAPQPEYSTPVGVVPVAPVNPAPVTPPPVTPRPATPVTPPSATPQPAGRKHVVSKGDTLQSIALRYYGSRSRFRDILAANRDQLPTENSPLRIGMELRIP